MSRCAAPWPDPPDHSPWLTHGPNGTASWRIVVTNTGLGALNNVTVSDAQAPGCQVAVLDTQAEMRPDIGGVSRFFYTPRASAKERPTYVDAAGQTVRHNTIKPVALMRWLVRLSCPPGGHIVDPFAGSGTTVEAAVLEGFEVTAFERDERFLPLIEQRIARCSDGLVDPRDATSAA